LNSFPGELPISQDIARENIFPSGISKSTGHWTTVTTARPGKLVFVWEIGTHTGNWDAHNFCPSAPLEAETFPDGRAAGPPRFRRAGAPLDHDAPAWL